jgi:hypothetical protein
MLILIFQPAAIFVLLVSFRKSSILKVVYLLTIYQNINFHGPNLTGADFAYASEALTSTILEWLQQWR